MATTKHERYKIKKWENKSIKSWWGTIYIGGDYVISENVCREMCFPSGLAVTIKPIKYIFAGGTEDGVEIGLVQYPPFPEDENILLQKAINLGIKIAEANYQWSFLVVTPQINIFYSRRNN